MDKQILSLGEVALSFLTTLSPEERRDKQQEVNRFVLWYGKECPISQITPSQVANYAEWIGTSGGEATRKLEPVKALLTYAKKEGIVGTSLAPHLRARKASIKNAPTKPRQVALTPESYAQLKSQLAALQEERYRIAEELRQAAADKDFRENAPLQAAREQRDQIEAKIRELRASLSNAAIVEEKLANDFTVRLGSKVILRDTASGRKLTYTLVTKNEADPAKNKISIASPIGKALLNQHKGDEVKVTAPMGELCYQIEQIE